MKNLKTQFAVVLLFTFCLLTGAYGQITPSQDAYTNSVDPTTNYGTAVTLGVVSSATSIQSTYIQFDLSSIPAGYTSANVAKATLKLYVNAVATAGSFNVDYVNGTWTEKTIKASLAPALGGTIVASVPLTSSNVHDYVLIDVTSAVDAWLNGTQTNDGIALVANSPLSATIDSKESTSQSHPAELDVVFNGAITGVTTASGSGLTGGGTSGTLNLSLTGCAANQVLKYNGTSWACAATGTGTVTSVGSGAGLTGGPITGSGTLSIPTGGVTNAMLATSYAQLGAANTFAANQTLNGTLNATSSGITIAGATSGTTGVGLQGIAQPTTGNTMGVQGISNSPTGDGVAGQNNATTGNAIGVYGTTNSPIGYGVYGTTPGTTQTPSLSPAGVFGVTASGTGYGVEGQGPYVGVYGQTVGTATGVAGVLGFTSSPNNSFGVEGNAILSTGNSVGVFGITDSPSGYGVLGQNGGVTGTAPGVYGTTNSPVGYGVEGAGPTGVYGGDTSAAGDGTGVYGTSPSGYGVYGTSPYNIGVYGTSPYIGVYGTGEFGVYGESSDEFGVYGYTTSGTGVNGHSASAYGVVASSGTGSALLADNDDSTGSFPTMIVENDTTATHNPVFQTSSPNTYSNTRHCTIDTSANLTCTGVLTGSIQVGDGKETAVYAMQSADNWLEDAGSGQLSSGSARIALDPAFAQTVNAGVEYHVFLTPRGECEGLYVGATTANGFEVHELHRGTSSIAFDYRIMAKRKGYENVRLEDLTGRFKQPTAPPQKMRRPLPLAATRPTPKPPTPPSVAMHSAPHLPTPRVMPPAALQSKPVTSKPIPLSPGRTAVKPLAAQPK